jgi:polyisoprenoid-binding protein YceI
MINRLRLFLPVVVLLATSASFAQERIFRLDPSHSQVSWTLGDVLHTVHGRFQLKSGVLYFDPSTGSARGELVVDATSGESGNNSRDKKMKREILETDRFPTIVFSPQHVKGAVAANGGSQVQLQGTMTLHGGSHPMTIVVPVEVNGGRASADVHFVVPYVE